MSSTVSPQRERVPKQLMWGQLIPYVIIHFACLLVFWVGWSPVALIMAGVLYAIRVFALTAFYHRYFSHRAFKTSRAFQFIGAVLANSSMQRGPLWWAAHHRLHHRLSDAPGDLHSPHQDGFIWSHMGWFHDRTNQHTNHNAIRDFAKFRELVLIDKYDFVVPLLLAGLLYGLGVALEAWAPGLKTNGLQMLVWGWMISTVAVYHVTYSINSIAHLFGSRRFTTDDSSRNNWLLALVTFGEGWHNNHHHYPNAARQGFYWWELDISYLILVMLSWIGVVWDLHAVPDDVLELGRSSPTLSEAA